MHLTLISLFNRISSYFAMQKRAHHFFRHILTKYPRYEDETHKSLESQLTHMVLDQREWSMKEYF